MTVSSGTATAMADVYRRGYEELGYSKVDCNGESQIGKLNECRITCSQYTSGSQLGGANVKKKAHNNKYFQLLIIFKIEFRNRFNKGTAKPSIPSQKENIVRGNA